MRSSKRGFTLLETVIALALASAGLASVYQVYASAARAERAANEAGEIVRLAEALRHADTSGEGETGGIRWSVAVRPSPGFADLEQVTLRLTSASGREHVIEFDRPRRRESGQP